MSSNWTRTVLKLFQNCFQNHKKLFISVAVLVTKYGHRFATKCGSRCGDLMWSWFWWPNVVSILMTKCGHRFDDQICFSALHCVVITKCGRRFDDQMRSPFWWPNVVTVLMTKYGNEIGNQIWLSFLTPDSVADLKTHVSSDLVYKMHKFIKSLKYKKQNKYRKQI